MAFWEGSLNIWRRRDGEPYSTQHTNLAMPHDTTPDSHIPFSSFCMRYVIHDWLPGDPSVRLPRSLRFSWRGVRLEKAWRSGNIKSWPHTQLRQPPNAKPREILPILAGWTLACLTGVSEEPEGDEKLLSKPVRYLYFSSTLCYSYLILYLGVFNKTI